MLRPAADLFRSRFMPILLVRISAVLLDTKMRLSGCWWFKTVNILPEPRFQRRYKADDCNVRFDDLWLQQSVVSHPQLEAGR